MIRRPLDEVWVEVEGFPNYAVSNTGKVMNRLTNRMLRPRINSYNYGRVGLRREGKTYDVYIHHLVAKHFITGYRPGVRIKHAENNEDNGVMNLRFRGDVSMRQMVKNPAKATSRRVKIVETNQVFLTVESCANYIDGDPSSIYRVLRGDRISHKGFTFEYQYEEQQ